MNWGCATPPTGARGGRSRGRISRSTTRTTGPATRPLPARLYPPYARAADGTPVWSEDLPQVSLEPLLTRPVPVLPLAVDAELRPRARGARLRLRLHELYGRVAQAGPEAVEVEWRHRDDGGEAVRGTTALVPSAGTWSAETTVDLPALAAHGVGTWDLRLRIRFRDGVSRDVTAHALTGAGLLRRSALPSARHGVVLVQPYATHSGALALRVAPGARGVLSVARGRLRRLLH